MKGHILSQNIPNQNWLQLATIQVAGAICLPILMIGEQLGRTYGFKTAIISILLGNSFLCVIAIITALMAYQFKEYTIENAIRYFGVTGTKLLGCNMLLSLIGWFAIQLNVISLSIEKSCLLLFGYQIPITMLNMIIGLGITLASLCGVESIKKIANISMPFFIGTMAIALLQTLQNPTITPTNIINSYQGVSLVIATAIMAVIDLPTYYRFAKSSKDSVISIVILFIITIPLLEIIGAYIALHNQGTNILETLTAHHNVIWQLWIFLFLILAGWTTNNMNLYSATTALQTIAPRLNYATQTLLLGFAGTILSCFDLLKNLEPILNGIGILISSMGGVMVTNFLLQKYITQSKSHAFFVKNIIAWSIGSTIGFLTFFGYTTLTQFEIIDAYCIATIATTLIQLFL